MKKAEILATIESVPAESLAAAVLSIDASNPANALTMNRAGFDRSADGTCRVYFSSRATKENMLNALHAILDEIVCREGIDAARQILPGYTPEWYKEAPSFGKLEKLLNKQNAETISARKFFIRNGYMPTWADKEKSDNGIREYLTPGAWDKYSAGKMTRREAIEKATARMIKKAEKDNAATIEKLRRVAAADQLDSVSIYVEWKRSATWGHNPHAEITAYTAGGCNWETTKGTASGCGYDKETAAVGAALNQIPAVLKMLYTTKEKNLTRGNKAIKEKGGKPTAWNVGNRAYIAYGAGYGVLPYFEGGVGMSSFEAVFNACGFKLKHQNHTKTSDYYMFERG